MAICPDHERGVGATTNAALKTPLTLIYCLLVGQDGRGGEESDNTL